jgi:hypothetical protein
MVPVVEKLTVADQERTQIGGADPCEYSKVMLWGEIELNGIESTWLQFWPVVWTAELDRGKTIAHPDELLLRIAFGFRYWYAVLPRPAGIWF